MTEDLLQYAGVNRNGSILLGANTVADGYQHGRTIGIFTHIHDDHTSFFTNALHECHSVYLSPPTFELLAALEMDENETVSAQSYFGGRHVHRLDFDEPHRPKKYPHKPDSPYSDEITLLPAKHILGSAQVQTCTMDGKRIVYSSDFVYPGTEPVQCDVLVLDSTHGVPHFDAPLDPPSMERRIVELIDEEIQKGMSITVRAHRGRLQYIMSILSNRFSDVPFLIGHKADQKIIPIYTKYGMPIKDTILSDSLDGDEIVSSTSRPFIEFKMVQAGYSQAERSNNTTVFSFGRRRIGHKMSIVKNETGNGYDINPDDHANYDGILEYVRRCNPKLVITDTSRGRLCEALAHSISESLDINAIPQPQSYA